MLIELRIQNLILIPSAVIHFEKGLNVLSGETGSGKSAVIKALYILSGEKVDTSVIRHGAEKATIEGLFDIDSNQEAKKILEAYNIDHEANEELIVKREISKNGKSRCTINNQAAQLMVLKKLSDCLLEMVGQHANQRLLSTEHHRRILDIYGDLIPSALTFANAWTKEIHLADKLDQLIKSESQRLREIEICRQELEDITEVNLKEDEEEILYSEYSRLSNADIISTTLREIADMLDGERHSILSQLKKHITSFDHLISLDSTFNEPAMSYKNAFIELQEVSYTLNKLSSKISHNPERLAEINERLSLINKLKRRYGATFQEVINYRETLVKKLADLESADIQIEEGERELTKLKSENDRLAKELTTRRKEIAEELGTKIIEQLCALNMPKAQFEIAIRKQQRSQHGDDGIEFFLIPNIGERRVPIKEHASGGELSRILLALQTLLAGKESIPTIVFDEIDANIGGATAVVIGEKLVEVGKKHQVLCITHFPQVAKQADFHIQIEKHEENGRTFSQITRLDAKGRKKEINRMLGI